MWTQVWRVTAARSSAAPCRPRSRRTAWGSRARHRDVIVLIDGVADLARGGGPVVDDRPLQVHPADIVTWSVIESIEADGATLTKPPPRRPARRRAAPGPRRSVDPDRPASRRCRGPTRRARWRCRRRRRGASSRPDRPAGPAARSRPRHAPSAHGSGSTTTSSRRAQRAHASATAADARAHRVAAGRAVEGRPRSWQGVRMGGDGQVIEAVASRSPIRPPSPTIREASPPRRSARRAGPAPPSRRRPRR